MDIPCRLNTSMDNQDKNQVERISFAYPMSIVFFPLTAMILYILILQPVLGFFGASALETEEILRNIGIIFCMACLFGGSFTWTVGRYVSDAQKQGQLSTLYASFQGSLLMCLIPGMLCYGGYLWWMQTSPVWMLLYEISFALIVCIGILLNYLCAVYAGKKILWMLLVGGLCMCLPMFLSPFVPSVYLKSYLVVCINFGFSILLGLLMGRFRMLIHADAGSLRHFFSYIKKYTALILIPILYLTGMYVAGLYDPLVGRKSDMDFLTLFYVAAVATLPGMGYAMLWLDREYFANLERLMLRLYQEGTYEAIVVAGTGLWQNLKFELKIFLLSQCIWTWIMIFLWMQWIVPEGNVSAASLPWLFYAVALSVTIIVQVVNAYLLSLDRQGFALQVAIVYCFTSVCGGGILQYLGIKWGGAGMLIGACTSLVYGVLCFRRVYLSIDRFLFQTKFSEIPKA